MIIKIIRDANIPNMGMYGRFEVNGFTGLTVEREWLDNKSCVSCIPAGTYKLEKHLWHGTFSTFALVGNTVSHKKIDGFERNNVLFHPANVPTDLQGCIAFGENRGFIKNQYAITNSRKIVAKVLRILNCSKDKEHTVIITNPKTIK